MKTITAFVLLFASGCATVFTGTTQEIQVASTPAGARVCAEDQCVISPGVLTLHRGSDYTVFFNLDGYMPQVIELKRGPNHVTGYNAVGIFPISLGTALIGGVVDASSGAAYKLSPGEIDVMLKPTGQ